AGKPCFQNYECKEQVCQDVCLAKKGDVSWVLIVVNVIVVLAIVVFLIFTLHMDRKKPPMTPPLQ
ncbi:MAG TPA: hypothetical protein VJB87_01105, partial [Candidatus Nanoarchaeia archaeon]|nr:hypothetical protein [Candidatus Nanoarchaeia archaeon]